ncbi:MAG: hypothetical protein NUV74_14720, partial [Candidatus Brocadiaceae bacterium]|nr:hypothetical protein [Candidatus Brocadiaceae bacterium]
LAKTWSQILKLSIGNEKIVLALFPKSAFSFRHYLTDLSISDKELCLCFTESRQLARINTPYSHTPKGHLYLVTPSSHLTMIRYLSTHTDCSIVWV